MSSACCWRRRPSSPSILFLFLLNVRATAISLTAIPISILVTVVVFQVFGLTINTMTLGGLAIAIGELVDDAVVDVENILRRLQGEPRAADPRPVLEVIAAASQEVRSGIVYATMIIILVFVPLFALSGIEGRLFAPLGVAYIVSILASLVTSITVTPVLAYYLLPGKRDGHERDSVARAPSQSAATRALPAWALRPPRVAVRRRRARRSPSRRFAATLLPRAFLPPFNEGTLTISLAYNPGISLAESQPRSALVAESLIAEVPEVALRRPAHRPRRTRRARRGRPLVRDRRRPEAVARARRSEVMADMRARLVALPGVAQHRPADLAPAGPHALGRARRDRAQDLRRGPRHPAQHSRKACASGSPQFQGLVDLQVEKQVRIPQLRIDVDYERAALYGLTPAAVTRGAGDAVERAHRCRRSSRATAASTWSCASPTRTARRRAWATC